MRWALDVSGSRHRLADVSGTRLRSLHTKARMNPRWRVRKAMELTQQLQ